MTALKLPGKRLPKHGGSADFNSGYNAALYEVQFLNPGAQCIPGQTPIAQDVSGLVEALEFYAKSGRSGLVARGAQQGEQT